MTRIGLLASAALASILAGCATTPAIPNGLHWYMTSAEKRVLYTQIYGIAADRLLERAAGRARGTWAVIADADETLLDNFDYQYMLARTDTRYDEATWQSWARLRRAVALPGAREFIERINAAGGRVVVVTNRVEPICEDTRANLASESLRVAGVLCAPLDPVTGRTLSDKLPRFQAVAQGTTGLGLPALEVLGYVGDNIKDFPGRSQQNAEPLAEFGISLFLLPNPMYGSWESNPIP